MPRKTTEKRRLIKFSNYSMCITLPKWVVDQLEWKKGDELTLTTDIKQGKIILTKEQPKDTAENPTDTPESSPSDTNNGNQQTSSRLRW